MADRTVLPISASCCGMDPSPRRPERLLPPILSSGPSPRRRSRVDELWQYPEAPAVFGTKWGVARAEKCSRQEIVGIARTGCARAEFLRKLVTAAEFEGNDRTGGSAKDRPIKLRRTRYRDPPAAESRGHDGARSGRFGRYRRRWQEKSVTGEIARHPSHDVIRPSCKAALLAARRRPGAGFHHDIRWRQISVHPRHLRQHVSRAAVDQYASSPGSGSARDTDVGFTLPHSSGASAGLSVAFRQSYLDGHRFR